MANKLLAYTDGSSTGKIGPGSWAYVIVDSVTDLEISRGSGFSKRTTNNRMELLGPIAVLRITDATSAITIVSDSQYVCNGATEWLWKWCKTGWRGDMIKNRDLWEVMRDLLLAHRKASFLWVKGHRDNKWNNIVDKLSVEVRKSRT